MPDRRKYNGGFRKGSGRKTKVEEQELIDKLSPLDDLAFKTLNDALERGERWAVMLFFNYYYGKPTERRDDFIFQEQPLFP